ncbi:hypothetical protein REPUB_Repub09cG0031100 [Reevesia pubescens]
MTQISIWVFSVSFFLITHLTNSVDDGARASLVEFFSGLSTTMANQIRVWVGNWNLSSDPCTDKWKGVACDNKANSLVKKIVFDNSNLSGFLNFSAIFNVQSLAGSLNVLNLNMNNIGGEIQADIGNCKQLTRLILDGNQFFGNLPVSLATLSNLKQLYISSNRFSGDLPGNPELCGEIVQKKCPPSKKKSNGLSKKKL